MRARPAGLHRSDVLAKWAPKLQVGFIEGTDGYISLCVCLGAVACHWHVSLAHVLYLHPFCFARAAGHSPIADACDCLIASLRHCVTASLPCVRGIRHDDSLPHCRVCVVFGTTTLHSEAPGSNFEEISEVPFAEHIAWRGFESPYYTDSHIEFREEFRAWVNEHMRASGLAEELEESGARVPDELFHEMGKRGILAARLGPGAPSAFCILF